MKMLVIFCFGFGWGSQGKGWSVLRDKSGCSWRDITGDIASMAIIRVPATLPLSICNKWKRVPARGNLSIDFYRPWVLALIYTWLFMGSFWDDEEAPFVGNQSLPSALWSNITGWIKDAKTREVSIGKCLHPGYTLSLIFEWVHAKIFTLALLVVCGEGGSGDLLLADLRKPCVLHFYAVTNQRKGRAGSAAREILQAQLRAQLWTPWALLQCPKWSCRPEGFLSSPISDSSSSTGWRRH